MDRAEIPAAGAFPAPSGRMRACTFLQVAPSGVFQCYRHAELLTTGIARDHIRFDRHRGNVPIPKREHSSPPGAPPIRPQQLFGVSPGPPKPPDRVHRLADHDSKFARAGITSMTPPARRTGERAPVPNPPGAGAFRVRLGPAATIGPLWRLSWSRGTGSGACSEAPRHSRRGSEPGAAAC
jgi:hypothetical protein